MTKKQVLMMIELRKQGLSVREISEKLNISFGAIKSSLYRWDIKTPEDAANFDVLDHSRRKMPRNYKTVVCRNCGKEFFVYPYEQRIFCTHDCYIHYRFRVVPQLKEEEEKRRLNEPMQITRGEIQTLLNEMIQGMIESGEIIMNPNAKRS